MASVSGMISSSLQLDRSRIRETLAKFSRSCALQSTHWSIICATGFEHFEGGRLFPTIYQLCGQNDSLSHPFPYVQTGAHLQDCTLLPDYLSETPSRAYCVTQTSLCRRATTRIPKLTWGVLILMIHRRCNRTLRMTRKPDLMIICFC